MKPSESIQEILKSNSFTAHIKISDTSSAIVAAIIQYLDNDWEKNKPCEHEETEPCQYTHADVCKKCQCVITKRN